MIKVIKPIRVIKAIRVITFNSFFYHIAHATFLFRVFVALSRC